MKTEVPYDFPQCSGAEEAKGRTGEERKRIFAQYVSSQTMCFFSNQL
jgi:hypothetical protein